MFGGQFVQTGLNDVNAKAGTVVLLVFHRLRSEKWKLYIGCLPAWRLFIPFLPNAWISILVCSITVRLTAEDADGICLCNSALHNAEAWLWPRCTVQERPWFLSVLQSLTLTALTSFTQSSALIIGVLLFYGVFQESPAKTSDFRPLIPPACISFFRRTGPPEGPNREVDSRIWLIPRSRFLVHVPCVQVISS